MPTVSAPLTPSTLDEAQARAVQALRRWHLSGEEDVTLFEGFSLGATCRLDLSEGVVRLFRQAAKGLDPAEPGFLDDGTVALYGPEPERSLTWYRGDWKARAFRLFYRAAGLRGRAGGKGVLVLGSPSNRPLWEYWLDGRPGSEGLRLDFALRFPPGARNARRAVLRGSRMFDPAPASLTSAQRTRVEEIGRRLAALTREPSWRRLFEVAGRDYSGLFEREQLAVFSRKLEALAVKALSFERGFLEARPDLVLLPQDGSSEARLLVALGRKHGVPVWLLNHGFPYHYSFERHAIWGDRDVDRILAWSEADAENYVRTGIDRARVRPVGIPAFEDLPRAAHSPLRRVAGAEVLALAYSRSAAVAHFLEENEERHFTGIARLLDRLGARKLLFKVHPGRDYVEPYRRMAAKLGLRLPVEFYCDESFTGLVRRADAVIGPLSTAIFESLLLGKDYFLFHLDLCDLPPPFELSNSFVAADAAALERNLVSGNPVPRSVLRDFCGLREGDEPGASCRRVFDELSRALLA